MAKKTSLRYAQLTEGQRAELVSKRSSVVIHPGLDSYTGPKENTDFFQTALAKFRISVEGMACAELFVTAFIRWCNVKTRKSKRSFEDGQSRFTNGFAAFLRITGRIALPISDIDTEIIKEYIDWLNGKTDDNPKSFSNSTRRRYYDLLASFIKELTDNPTTKSELSPDLVVPKNPFSGNRRGENNRIGGKTIDKVLDDGNWQSVIDACRREIAHIVEIRAQAELVWALPDIPDSMHKKRTRFNTIQSVWWELNRLYPDSNIPSLAELKRLHPELGKKIQKHRYAKCVMPLQPEPHTIFPFALLISIYTLANYGPLLSLTHQQISEKVVMGVARCVFDLIKPRGTDYRRSFAIDGDIFNPSKLNDFLKKWTERIRHTAGEHAKRIFIFATQSGQVRGYLVGKDDGTDSDQAWKNPLKSFRKRHGLRHFTLQVIRVTGLDLVRNQSNDDIRAVKVAGGNKSDAVIRDHYEGPGAKRRRSESLAQAAATQERWYTTNGKIDHRKSPSNSDISAATPGWNCSDPFDSPIAGEIEGRLCQAFGQCPACPLGFPDLDSAYSLARSLQLYDEVIAARTYLQPKRWKAAFEPVLLALKHTWLPAFNDEKVRREACCLQLNPIGVLE